MLIDEVDIEFPHLLPAIVEVLAISRRPRCATNLYIRILCAYLLDEHLEALCIERSPLFVADTYLLEVERLRMAELSTYLSPLGIDVTIAELDEVEGIVDIRLEVLEGHMSVRVVVGILELAGQSAREYGQWLRANLLG